MNTRPTAAISRPQVSNSPTRNSWKSGIFDARQYFEEEKIKRASILVLTFYRKIRTLAMVIR